MEQNTIQIDGIAINVHVSVKNIIYIKKNTFRILLHVTMKSENLKYLASAMHDSVIMCYKVMKSYDEEVETVPTTFNEKNITCKTHKVS